MRSKSVSVLGHVSPTLTDFTPLRAGDVYILILLAFPYPLPQSPESGTIALHFSQPFLHKFDS